MGRFKHTTPIVQQIPNGSFTVNNFSVIHYENGESVVCVELLYNKEVFRIIFKQTIPYKLAIGEKLKIKSFNFSWKKDNLFVANSTLKKVVSFGLDSGEYNKITNYEFNLSWDDVCFEEAKIRFRSPFSDKGGRGLYITWKDSSPNFELIKDALSEKIPNVKVTLIKNNITKILNLKEIQESIVNLTKKQKEDIPLLIDKSKSKLKTLDAPIRCTVAEAKKRAEIQSSDYLKFLCSQHSLDFPIFYCVENKNTETGTANSEKAFIFTLKSTPNKVLIIYENTLDSRSSYLFSVKKSFYQKAIDHVHSYFSSDAQNKREKLAYKTVVFPKSIFLQYNRIIHSSFNQWESEILFIIKNFI